MLLLELSLHSFKRTHHHLTQHISSISRIEQEKYVWMTDLPFEILNYFTLQTEESNTEFDILRSHYLPMGSRMITRDGPPLPFKKKNLRSLTKD